jgi:hypothetical protein
MHAILRSYNTDKVLTLIDHLKAIDLITCFTVVINSKKDRLDTARLLETRYPSTRIITVPLENYGWSKAINAGIRSLPPIRNDQEMVMVVSNEVQILPGEVDLLRRSASLPQASCGYALFEGRDEPTYRLPRNTFIIWKRSVFEEVGLFDENLDDDTGMEDYDMVLRAYHLSQLLPFIGPKSVRIGPRLENNMAEKLAWESRGVEIVERRYPPALVSKMREHIRNQNES